MGRKDKAAATTNNAGTRGGSLAVSLDEDGKVDYTALVGANSSQKVQGKHKDMVASVFKADDLKRPEPEEEAATTERTKAALEKLIDSKLKSAKPTHLQDSVQENLQQEATFVRYTPSNPVAGIKERIIRLTEAQVDPLEPAKFQVKKVPRGPPSPPVPVMHSPPKKLSAKEAADWKIPPCISNWKNNKGYTIALDKRLAADGRGLQEVVVNDNFAKFAESLYIAERSAREQVSKRAELEKALKLKEKEAKEDKLRQLAEEARREREQAQSQRIEDSSEESERRERDQIRKDRQREIERDLRIQRNRSQASRNTERDVTEKIALGLAVPQTTGEALFDQRLFNQSEGISSGFGEDDSYNIYNKPLFSASSGSQIYRPKKGDDESYGNQQDFEKLLDTTKFRPDKGFSGAVNTSQSAPKGGRDKPVEFEKQEPEQDPFGIDEFLHTAKDSQKKKPLDKIGNTGHMHAASTSSASNISENGGSRRNRINFESSSSSSNNSNKRARDDDDDDSNKRRRH